MKIKRLLLSFTVGAAMIIVTLLTIMTIKPALADGNVYYVDAVNGNDLTNVGDQANPWKTISHAANNVAGSSDPADPNIILVQPGTYDAANGESFPLVWDVENIILRGNELPENVIIDGGGADSIISVTAQGIGITNFTIQNGETAVYVQKGGVQIQDNVFKDIILGVDMHDSGRVGNSTYTWGDIAIISNTFTTTNIAIRLDTNLWGDWSGGDSAQFTFGDTDILSNTFNLSGTSAIGVSWYNDIAAINNGSLTVGDLMIAANHFYSGNTGINLSLQTDFSIYTETAVSIGDVTIERNILENQSKTAVVLPSQGGYAWHNGTTGSFGDVVMRENRVINAGVCGFCTESPAFANIEFDGDAASVSGDIFVQNNTITAGKQGIFLNSGGAVDLKNSAAITIGHTYIQSNTVTVGTHADAVGIYSGYDVFGYELYDSASVYAGNTTISNNNVTGTHGIEFGYAGTAASVFSDTVTTVGEVYIRNNNVHATVGNGIEFKYYEDTIWGYGVADVMAGNAQFAAGDVYIEDNNISTTIGTGVQIKYDKHDVGLGYENATAKLPDYIIRGNTFNISSTEKVNSVHWHNDSNPQSMHGDADLDFGQLLIDDNTFNGGGVYYENEYACEDGCENNSTIIFSDTIVTDNDFYEPIGSRYVDSAVHVGWFFPGWILSDTAAITVGKTIVSGNVISGFINTGGGIRYTNEDSCYINCGDDTSVSFDDVIIKNNQISGTTGTGIRFMLEELSYKAADSSTAQMGELIIVNNVLDGIGLDGIDIWHYPLSTDTVSVTVGYVEVADNQISNVNDDGITIDYIANADADSSMTLGDIVVANNIIDQCGDIGIDINTYIKRHDNANISMDGSHIINNTVLNCDYVSGDGDGFPFTGIGINVNGNSWMEIVNNVLDVGQYGVIARTSDSAYIGNNTISKLISPTVGSGVRVFTGTVELTNNILSVDSGVGIWADSGSTVEENYTLFDNTISTQISGTVSGGTGSSNGDADFINPTNDDYHLQSTSDAIDNGETVTVIEDRDGVLRPQGSAYDIGAYEFVAPVDLGIIKSATPDVPLAPGDLITYTLDVINWSDSVVTNVIITDIMPISITVLNVSGSGVIITDTGVSPGFVWQVDDLSPYEQSMIVITGRLKTPLAAGSFTNTAIIASPSPESLPDDNQSSVTTIVRDVPPVAVDDSYNTPYETALNVNAVSGVLSNDYDDNGDGLTVSLDTNVSHGSLTLNTNGSFDYTPDGGFNGDDSFVYVASDGVLTDTAVVTITVASSPNSPPVANNDSYATAYESTLNVNAANGVLANDADPDLDSLTATLDIGVSNGSLTLNADGSFDYAPDNGFLGNDSFVYIASDGALTDTAVVTITVAAATDADLIVYKFVDNPAPYVGESIIYIIDVINNGPANATTIVISDVLPIGVTHVSDDSGGAYAAGLWSVGNLNAGGMATLYITVTVDAGTEGQTITNTAVINAVDQTDPNPANDTAFATITVAAATNNPPIANDDDYGTPYETTLIVDEASGVLSNDSDPDLDGLTVSLDTDVSHGSLTLNVDGSFDYIPDGGFSDEDSFIYIASDGVLTDTAVVTITVGAATNNPPVANDDDYGTAYESTLNVSEANGVLNNDTDPEFDGLTVSLDTNVSNGSLTLNGDGSFSYTPANSFSGEDVFSYIASDGVLTDTAVVTITVGASTPATYTLSVTIVGNGAVTLNPSGTQGSGETSFTSVFAEGTTVTLSATPDNGWIFGSWSGDGTAVSNQWQVVMDGNKSVTATFTQYQIYLPVILK